LSLQSAVLSVLGHWIWIPKIDIFTFINTKIWGTLSLLAFQSQTWPLEANNSNCCGCYKMLVRYIPVDRVPDIGSPVTAVYLLDNETLFSTNTCWSSQRCKQCKYLPNVFCSWHFSRVPRRACSPTAVQAWRTCPLWEPSPSHPILV